MCGPVEDFSHRKKGWNADLTNGDVKPVSGKIFAQSWPTSPFLPQGTFTQINVNI